MVDTIEMKVIGGEGTTEDHQKDDEDVQAKTALQEGKETPRDPESQKPKVFGSLPWSKIGLFWPACQMPYVCHIGVNVVTVNFLFWLLWILANFMYRLCCCGCCLKLSEETSKKIHRFLKTESYGIPKEEGTDLEEMSECRRTFATARSTAPEKPLMWIYSICQILSWFFILVRVPYSLTHAAYATDVLNDLQTPPPVQETTTSEFTVVNQNKAQINNSCHTHTVAPCTMNMAQLEVQVHLVGWISVVVNDAKWTSEYFLYHEFKFNTTASNNLPQKIEFYLQDRPEHHINIVKPRGYIDTGDWQEAHAFGDVTAYILNRQ